eukprot:m.17257 g.17257  ORF g.17257 m.17257 type:complete len:104 (-) comp8122_c0_seq2:795-1106(-)
MAITHTYIHIQTFMHAYTYVCIPAFTYTHIHTQNIHSPVLCFSFSCCPLLAPSFALTIAVSPLPVFSLPQAPPHATLVGTLPRPIPPHPHLLHRRLILSLEDL